MLEQGLRTGLRLMTRQRGFATALILTLALGVGGVTAFFAVLYGAALRPLPYPRSGELVLFQWQGPGGGASYATSEGRFRAWQAQPSPFAALAAHQLKSAGQTVGDPGGEPRYVQTLKVSTSFFETLAVAPFLGRVFLPNDGYAGASCSVVVAHDFWRHDLAEQWPAEVRVGGEHCQVVGVMPTDFRFAPAAQLWVPQRAGGRSESGANLYAVLGRLAEGFDRRQAENAVNAMGRAVAASEPRVAETERIRLLSLEERLRGAGRARLWPLALAGGLVLFVCLLNLSHLLVAYVGCRQQSLSLRRVLGAPWTRIGTGILAELTLPTLTGIGLGLVLASAVLAWVSKTGALALSAVAVVSLGWVEFAFAAWITVLCMGLVVTVLVVRMARRESSSALRPEAAHRSCTRIVGRPLARRLVAIQVACSLAVLFTTFLFYGNLQRLGRVDLGFDTAGVWTFQAPREAVASTAGNQRFTEAVIERLQLLPGVTAVATTTSLPTELGLNIPAEVESGQVLDAASVELRAVSPDYFRALSIRIEQGRGLDPLDQAGTSPVAVVNEAFQRRFWGRGPERDAPSAVGQRLRLARGLGPLSDAPREVVGIAADVRTAGPAVPVPAIVYVPRPQLPEALQELIDQAFPVSFVVRLENERTLDPRRVRALVRDVEPWQALTAHRGMAEVVQGALSGHRLHALLAVLFGFLGLSLSSLGIFGVTHADVVLRTREFGVRKAIGACENSVLRLVLGTVLGRTLAAIVVGLPLCGAVFRGLGSLVVFDDDWLAALGGAALCVLAVAVLAAVVPAWRAARLDPLCALRSEES